MLSVIVPVSLAEERKLLWDNMNAASNNNTNKQNDYSISNYHENRRNMDHIPML
jgi:hypothetical protein